MHDIVRGLIWSMQKPLQLLSPYQRERAAPVLTHARDAMQFDGSFRILSI